MFRELIQRQMKYLHDILFNLRGVSLKLKLLIPFLMFALSSTSILTVISMRSQQNLIKKEEKDMMSQNYRHFIERLEQRELQALSIASSIAEIPDVGDMPLHCHAEVDCWRLIILSFITSNIKDSTSFDLTCPSHILC